MPIPYVSGESPRVAISPAFHFRRRSSVASLLVSTPGSSPPRSPPIAAHTPPTHQTSLRQPFISQLIYDEKSGEIDYPCSPPTLSSWPKKSSSESLEEKSSPTSSRFHLHAYGTRRRASPPKGRPFQLPRPWLSVIALISVTLSFVVLLTYLVPSSYVIPHRMDPRGPATPYTMGSAASALLFHKSTKCEPYSAFGALYADTHDPDANRWIPFDEKCQAPNFLSRLRNDQTTADFSWLRNRTALIIGDQISREHVENFCILMGKESEVIRDDHKYSPGNAIFRMPAKAQHLGERPSRIATRSSKSAGRSLRDTSWPRMCYIPQYDFMVCRFFFQLNDLVRRTNPACLRLVLQLVSIFHFGLDQEDFWRDSEAPQYVAPGMFEHRLADVVEPVVRALRADGRASAPDFVEVTSGVWDLARWAQQDITAQQDTAGPLAKDRVTWYRFRVGQALEKVRKMFPDAKAKTWRTLHYPLDAQAEREYFFEKIAPRQSNSTALPEPPFFSHARINQLDEAVRSLLLPTEIGDLSLEAPHPDFRLNEWGTMLKGHEAHQLDRIHGDPLPGGYLWADVMLYELWRGVMHSERRSLRSGFHLSRTQTS
ncbi:BZ3500_MvSof-1268-A1-R1_Chr2-1g04188 [Microbotryum saponariae]|uniref:BZ3500_MvSof-1268-A1-R1_Chr2-1g04188 protein n=1 Tax=Microbotryum saponariae TaxID=289078 RepID=A0A2X0K9W7_9BASI|nr:BZ3500_MvSof-1268-A1-R1_Chr2-1g04188 [Microbotryum saponariae]SCZ91175.1 BZ3501_MvSof-1269-A2-R1_Chr2-1g03844 [Microbotryum saponariae]